MGILIESKNYQGVRYYKLANGDIAYYVRFTKDGKQNLEARMRNLLLMKK